MSSSNKGKGKQSLSSLPIRKVIFYDNKTISSTYIILQFSAEIIKSPWASNNNTNKNLTKKKQNPCKRTLIRIDTQILIEHKHEMCRKHNKTSRLTKGSQRNMHEEERSSLISEKENKSVDSQGRNQYRFHVEK